MILNLNGLKNGVNAENAASQQTLTQQIAQQAANQQTAQQSALDTYYANNANNASTSQTTTSGNTSDSTGTNNGVTSDNSPDYNVSAPSDTNNTANQYDAWTQYQQNLANQQKAQNTAYASNNAAQQAALSGYNPEMANRMRMESEAAANAENREIDRVLAELTAGKEQETLGSLYDVDPELYKAAIQAISSGQSLQSFLNEVDWNYYTKSDKEKAYELQMKDEVEIASGSDYGQWLAAQPDYAIQEASNAEAFEQINISNAFNALNNINKYDLYDGKYLNKDTEAINEKFSAYLGLSDSEKSQVKQRTENVGWINSTKDLYNSSATQVGSYVVYNGNLCLVINKDKHPAGGKTSYTVELWDVDSGRSIYLSNSY